ncbi:MAG: hypothetical protein GY747_05170 [Planctomycetes bacterium]|nr:hypothetical protein [Planctomycetota bacterium]MCP4770916.1 hypothetical protein [Planctomycetota bacterium]MCP4862259.1 hypothetical protein [Planctomycetota bacterium]
MNKRNLFVLLPVLAVGACAQPETNQDMKPQITDSTTSSEVAVSKTVMLNVTGAT